MSRAASGTSPRVTRTSSRAAPDFAALYLARVKKAADTSTAGFRVHTAKDLLSIVAGILEGEMRRVVGDLPGAIESFRRAASQQEGLTYDEPEPLPFSAFHWLGAALLEGRRFEEAEQAYRTELKDHPHNGWSLIGLRQALAGLGKSSDEVDKDLGIELVAVGYLDSRIEVLATAMCWCCGSRRNSADAWPAAEQPPLVLAEDRWPQGSAPHQPGRTVAGWRAPSFEE